MVQTFDKIVSNQGTTEDSSEYILELENVRKYFPIKGGIIQRTVSYVRAVDRVSFKVRRGETIGIVGESGCGKTTLGRVILGLTDSTSGSIKYNGQEITHLSKRPEERGWRWRKNISGISSTVFGIILAFIVAFYFATGITENLIIWLPLLVPTILILTIGIRTLSTLSPIQAAVRRKMQIVFQDPYASLNPRSTAKKTLSEPILVHKIMDKEKIVPYLISLLEEVGLTETHLLRYPHEFSGGQRQRITIARALVLNPDLIILDEPTASADVSVRAKILNLLADLQKERGLTYLFISHDLSIIEFISDRIIVMYLGHVMEIGDKTIFRAGRETHPYTQALVDAIPKADPEQKGGQIILKGDVPSPINPPSGCVFHTRCPQAMQICRSLFPQLREVEDNHDIACHLFDEQVMSSEDTTPYVHEEFLLL